jgi:bacterioferritin (cytochrome b1)
MKVNPKVIDDLNEALRHEFTAVNQYWLHYPRADVASDDQAAPTHPATCETSLADSTEG